MELTCRATLASYPSLSAAHGGQTITTLGSSTPSGSSTRNATQPGPSSLTHPHPSHHSTRASLSDDRPDVKPADPGLRAPRGYDRRVLEHLPRTLLRAEGAAIAIVAVTLYLHAGYRGGSCSSSCSCPTSSMLGYVVGPSVGAIAYDLAHTIDRSVAPRDDRRAAGGDLAVELALIWLVHIGVDRAVGYGLKYPGGFKETHLQRV